jgi:hypothetical protein
MISAFEEPPVDPESPKSGVVATCTEALPPTRCPECGEPCAVATRTQDLITGRVTVYTQCDRCGRRWQPATKQRLSG